MKAKAQPRGSGDWQIGARKSTQWWGTFARRGVRSEIGPYPTEKAARRAAEDAAETLDRVEGE